MKLKTKILFVSLLPVICLGIILSIVASNRVKHAIYAESFTGMKATTIAIHKFLEQGNPGE